MKSTPQDEAEGRAIVQVLAAVLERIVSANSHLEATQQEVTKFHALSAPPIGILEYLERIHKYAYCSKECFVLALIYIDRLIQRNNFLLSSLNVHRVVITAVLLAAKFFDDAYCNNRSYAKVGGVEVREMNALECEFLFMIDFSLRVEPEEFDKYRDELISHSSFMGMEQEILQRVENYSGEESLIRSCNGQQAQAMRSAQFQDKPIAAAAPRAACHQAHVPEASHYPIQVIHQSTMETSRQAQVTQQHTTVAPLEPVCPFPTLPQLVSVQPQAHTPMLDPIELEDLVSYHADADAMAAASTAAVVDEDVPISQYNFPQDVNHAPPPQQGQAFSQSELMDSVYFGDFAAPAAAPMAQAPVYAQHTQQANYFTTDATTRGITPSPPMHIQHEAHRLLTRCGPSLNFADDVTFDLGVFSNGDGGVR